MKPLKSKQSLALGLLMAFMAGCVSTPASNPKADESITTAVFQQPVERVQQAAIHAFSVIGCNIKKQEPTYVEGFRPYRFGLFVGTGGETVGVRLTAQASDETEVRVEAAKSSLGTAGQKNWNEKVLAEMTKTLGK